MFFVRVISSNFTAFQIRAHDLVLRTQSDSSSFSRDVLAIITRDDSEFEGCEDESDEDTEDPDYTLSSEDQHGDGDEMEIDACEDDSEEDREDPDYTPIKESSDVLDVYQSSTGKKTTLGMGGDVVVKLCETLPASKVYKVFADNLFSSVPLVRKLLEQQIYFVGTLRNNPLAGCQLEDEKDLAKRGQGSVDCRVEKDDSIAIVKWYDNKSVTLISSVQLNLRIRPDTGANQTRYMCK
ncbi:hypothetical protein SKAU_G00266810 [Synaphobranchus kaupii]|uniref:Ig-like domain-containing protein n=1 Tax=Synaphobranchus kaupii TaxID=118154 RepID=A0A9Q1IPY6_SYNKA|nr:hypothetical protein SKAU_G00266810 [Synaphobranchus kaupii]